MSTRTSRKRVVTEDDMRKFHSRHLQIVIRTRSRTYATVEYLLDKHYRQLNQEQRKEVHKYLKSCRPGLSKETRKMIKDADIRLVAQTPGGGLSFRLVKGDQPAIV